MSSHFSARSAANQIEQKFESSLPPSFWRSLQTFDVSRIVIATVLLLYWSWRALDGHDATRVGQMRTICLVYVALAVLFSLLRSIYRRQFLRQVVGQITVDIIFAAVLFSFADDVKNGLVILFLFPLAGAAILLPLVLTLFFSSLVALYLLIESWYRVYVLAGTASFLQAGLYGAAFFAIVLVTNRLAARLIKQEELATQRGVRLEAQLAINRVVMADMGDGVLVVNGKGLILTCNPAAERMLGLTFPPEEQAQLTDIPALAPIAQAFSTWISQNSGAVLEEIERPFVRIRQSKEVSRGISAVTPRYDAMVHLKLRFVTVPSPEMAEQNSIVFLQDVSEIENRAQQLKLASMGRLTASIAHEVRNPLSAISHAAGLLNEEMANPVQRRLLAIIGDNVARVNRMVEDILKLSRKAQAYGKPIDLSGFLVQIKEELERTQVLLPGVLVLRDLELLRVRFDPLHLHEVIMNLLTNAVRYASGKSGSIRVYALGGRHSLELHVQDDGPPMPADVRAHLFEPFFTTSSKGTGLGLYLARELCLNNGATLDYEYRIDYPIANGMDHISGRFVITFALPDAAGNP